MESIIAERKLLWHTDRCTLKRYGLSIDNVYTLRYLGSLANGIEFDWDDENKAHLAAHKVTPAEFEQVIAPLASRIEAAYCRLRGRFARVRCAP